MNRLASWNRKNSPSSHCTGVVWVPWCFHFPAIKYGEADGLWLNECIKRYGILRWKVPPGIFITWRAIEGYYRAGFIFLIYLKCFFLSTSKMRKTSGFWAEPHKQCDNYLLAGTVLLQQRVAQRIGKLKVLIFFSSALNFNHFTLINKTMPSLFL